MHAAFAAGIEVAMINRNEIQEKAEELIARYQIPSVSITYYQNGSYETIHAGYKDADCLLYTS